MLQPESSPLRLLTPEQESLVHHDGYFIRHIAKNQFTTLSNIVSRSFSTLLRIPDVSLERMSTYFSPEYSPSSVFNYSVFDRTLNKQDSLLISSLTWLRELCTQLHMRPADAYGFGYPSMTWRLVRPNKANDLRAVHRDSWFRVSQGGPELLSPRLPRAIQTVKVWIALSVSPGLSGLLVLPGSQEILHESEFDIINRDNLTKPLIRESILAAFEPNLVHAPTPSGSYIVFGEQLVHGGAITSTATSRISLEILLAAPDQSFYPTY